MGTVVNVTLGEDTRLNLILGQQLENAVTAVVFNFSAWQTEFGSGTVGLSVQRHKDKLPYAVVPTVSGTNATWNITETDTGKNGVGEVQVTYTVGSLVKKSVVYKFTVYRSLGEDGEYPVPGQSWMEDIEERLEALEQGGSGSGLTDDVKTALLQLANKVAYADANGDDYYQDLYDALYPPEPQKPVVSISAVYTQSGTVYDTDSLNSLKAGLVVTATYNDSTSAVVSNYTLSGTLTAGTSTITVSYGGKTTTFTVTVTHNEQPLYDWDFTQSLVDSVGNVTAVLTGCTRNSNGVNFTADNQAIKLGSDKITVSDKTYIIDIPSMSLSDSSTNHGRFLCSDSTDTNTAAGAACFVYRHNYGWTVYSGSGWGTPSFDNTTYPADFFNNKRLKIYIGTDLKLTVSYATIGSNSFTEIGTLSLAFASTYESGYLVIGGDNTNHFSPLTISAIKIYEGEV